MLLFLLKVAARFSRRDMLSAAMMGKFKTNRIRGDCQEIKGFDSQLWRAAGGKKKGFSLLLSSEREVRDVSLKNADLGSTKLSSRSRILQQVS